jgi:hypothetical protein
MPRPRLIPKAGYDEIAEVARIRASLPGDVDLSRKWGVSRRRVQQIMRIARGALIGKLPVCALSESSDAT